MVITCAPAHRAASPVMNSVKKFAAQDKLVMGICNGFQILCEAGLLPGALIRNRELHFVCKRVRVRVEDTNTPFTHDLTRSQILTMPIAHAGETMFAMMARWRVAAGRANYISLL
jgi:phosphoribosylformylglycinamidine synthase